MEENYNAEINYSVPDGAYGLRGIDASTVGKNDEVQNEQTN